MRICCALMLPIFLWIAGCSPAWDACPPGGCESAEVWRANLRARERSCRHTCRSDFADCLAAAPALPSPATAADICEVERERCDRGCAKW